MTHPLEITSPLARSSNAADPDALPGPAECPDLAEQEDSMNWRSGCLSLRQACLGSPNVRRRSEESPDAGTGVVPDVGPTEDHIWACQSRLVMNRVFPWTASSSFRSVSVNPTLAITRREAMFHSQTVAHRRGYPDDLAQSRTASEASVANP